MQQIITSTEPLERNIEKCDLNHHNKTLSDKHFDLKNASLNKVVSYTKITLKEVRH